MTNSPKIFCAIDTVDIKRAVTLAEFMREEGCGVKLGLEFFASHGINGVRHILHCAQDTPVFLDLKFHDIPNTVAAAVTACADLDIAYLNVHAGGGLEMMVAAREAAYKINPNIQVLAVTVLTALDKAGLTAVGQGNDVAAQVLRLAKLTRDAGLAGVVCSAHEIEMLRDELGPDFVLMVPGIRPLGTMSNDQKRIMTPREALEKGASHLVIGRPITANPDPNMAARDIMREISGA